MDKHSSSASSSAAKLSVKGEFLIHTKGPVCFSLVMNNKQLTKSANEKEHGKIEYQSLL
jgi:hypothetical protein